MGKVLKKIVAPFVVICFWVLFSEISCAAVHNTLKSSPPYHQVYSLCGQHNERRIYLESGRTALISARDVQLLPPTPPPPHHPLNHNIVGRPEVVEEIIASTVPQECRIELVACSSCFIEWNVTKSNITDCSHPDSDRIDLSEPPYSSDASEQRVCTEDGQGETRTRNLIIRLIYTRNYTFAFDMEITVKRNQFNVIGEPTTSLTNPQRPPRFISTPFFPAPYPRDYEVEYNIECIGECQVHVNFIDFHLAPVSVLEIVDYKGERLEIFTGLTLRPRIFLSKGSTVTIRFSANGGIATGLNAEISFLHPKQAEDPEWNPNTDCGGHVDRLGGAITMMQMVKNNADYQFFDCIWLIRPSTKYYHLKTQESLKLATFSLCPNSQLTVRRGIHSNGEILGSFTDTSSFDAKSSMVSSTQDGYYVQLRGNFSLNSSLALVYTVFSFSNCYLGSDFVCANHMCITKQVRCDGFDHCGDGSDEPSSCLVESESVPLDRQWQKIAPNYYFPEAEYDLKAASVLFISSSAALIVLIAVLFLVLYRFNVRARNQRELQSQLQTISELLDQNDRPQIDPNEDQPPIYEAPPEYEQVIKVGMEKEMRRSKRRNREEYRRRRSKQPILDLEPEEDEAVAAPSFVESLAEPFPIEDATKTEETEAIKEFTESQDDSPSPQIVYECDTEQMKPVANGMLIVYQNDESGTALPVHEYISFDRDPVIKTCVRCENTNHRQENKFANRQQGRRFSVDPLIDHPSPGVELTRSFRL